MIKDILVHLEGSSEDEVRLAYAEALARQHGAHVTGLYCNIVPEMVIAGESGFAATQVIVDMQRQAIAQGEKTEAELRSRFSGLDVLSDVRRIDVQGSQAGGVLASEARTADVFVATRPYEHAAAQPELLEAVMFNSGRGTLFVPPGVKPKGPYKTVLLAWRNTREAARAVADAMPLLVGAEKVLVVVVSEGEAAEAGGAEPAADIARHLGRHGAKVEVCNVAGWSDAGKALLNEADKAGADMIVMGGYGHSRFRQWILGGVTQHVLSTAKVPVFMSH